MDLLWHLHNIYGRSLQGAQIVSVYYFATFLASLLNSCYYLFISNCRFIFPLLS